MPVLTTGRFETQLLSTMAVKDTLATKSVQNYFYVTHTGKTEWGRPISGNKIQVTTHIGFQIDTLHSVSDWPVSDWPRKLSR